MPTPRARHVVSALAVLAALASPVVAVAQRGGGGGPAAPAPPARVGGAEGPDGHLGVGGCRALAPPHARPAQGRVRHAPAQPGGAPDRRHLGSREGARRRRAVQRLRRRGHHAHSRDVSISPGPTTTRFGWTSTPAHRLASSTSAAPRRRIRPPTWQGYSAAEWEGIPAAELRSRTAGSGEDVRGGLRVITTRMRPGYLRKNGVPYSENARVEEHFDRFTEPNGDDWLVVDSIVTDPTYLTGPVHHERRVQEDSRPPGLGSHALPRQRSPLIYVDRPRRHGVTEMNSALCLCDSVARVGTALGSRLLAWLLPRPAPPSHGSARLPATALPATGYQLSRNIRTTGSGTS